MDDLSGSINMLTNNMLNAANVVMAYNKDKLDKKFTREMYLQQLNDNRENWDLMNKYNAPSAQMERLQAAGLNPNLVYGSGGVTGTTSMPQGSSSSPYHSPAPQFSMSPLQDYLALRNYEKSLQLIDVQIDKSRAETDNIRADEQLKRSQTGLNTIESYVQDQISEYRIWQQHFAAWRSQFESENEALFAVRKAEAEISKTIAQTVLLGKQGAYTDAQISSVLKDIEVKDATIQKIMADTQVSYAEAENLYDQVTSRYIHDDIDVMKYVLNPYGTSMQGQLKNAIDEVQRVYYDGDESLGSRIVSYAYKRLRGTMRNRKLIRRSSYPVRSR